MKFKINDTFNRLEKMLFESDDDQQQNDTENAVDNAAPDDQEEQTDNVEDAIPTDDSRAPTDDQTDNQSADQEMPAEGEGDDNTQEQQPRTDAQNEKLDMVTLLLKALKLPPPSEDIFPPDYKGNPEVTFKNMDGIENFVKDYIVQQEALDSKQITNELKGTL